MRLSVLVFLCLIVSFCALGQESETRSLGSFRGVKAAQAIDVYLKKGDKESVKVEITGGKLSDVLTEVSGSYLKIHMASNVRSNKGVKAYVTYVQLDKITASSASSVFSEGTISASSMEVYASSAANVEINIDATDVQVHVSSAGDVTLEGKAKSLDAEASSAGEVDAYNLTVESAEAGASSAGSIKLNVSQALNAQASSGGNIRYRGNPTKTNTNSSSGGSVKKSN